MEPSPVEVSQQKKSRVPFAIHQTEKKGQSQSKTEEVEEREPKKNPCNP